MDTNTFENEICTILKSFILQSIFLFIKCYGKGQCDFVEFRSLTLRPLLEPSQLSGKLNWIHNPEVNFVNACICFTKLLSCLSKSYDFGDFFNKMHVSMEWIYIVQIS